MACTSCAKPRKEGLATPVPTLTAPGTACRWRPLTDRDGQLMKEIEPKTIIKTQTWVSRKRLSSDILHFVSRPAILRKHTFEYHKA